MPTPLWPTAGRTWSAFRPCWTRPRRNEKRGLNLQSINKGAIAETDLDQCVTDRKSLEAQLELGEAMILESEADLDVAKTNLEFTAITSPVDGMVIDRKIDPGQTVASQFQTPVLFVVAPDLEKKIYVYASVDEADIGLIREAQRATSRSASPWTPIPRTCSTGSIARCALIPRTVQNVVTYTVVVESPNPEIKLLPGMTANLCFQIEKHIGVLTIPSAAFRFHPRPEQVRPERPADRRRRSPRRPGNQQAASADAGPTTERPPLRRATAASDMSGSSMATCSGRRRGRRPD